MNIDFERPWGNLSHQNNPHPYQGQRNGYQEICDKEYKVLPIVEADTIVNPRAVVVHVENALVAFRTVVWSLGFKIVANQAVFPLPLDILSVKAEVNWNRSRIGEYWTQVAPHGQCVEDTYEYEPDSKLLFPDEELID